MFADRACDRSDPEFAELAILRDIDRSEYWESRRNTVARYDCGEYQGLTEGQPRPREPEVGHRHDAGHA